MGGTVQRAAAERSTRFTMKGSHANRKATKAEMRHATAVIKQAFPQYDVVWGGHGDYGGHRAPRDHTVSFRLRDRWGKYHSNVVWVMPEALSCLTVELVRKMVREGNG
jgi:hypothetical protein